MGYDIIGKPFSGHLCYLILYDVFDGFFFFNYAFIIQIGQSRDDRILYESIHTGAFILPP